MARRASAEIVQAHRCESDPARGAAQPTHRLNAVCPYYTMFPLEFPLAALSDLMPGATVLDPFCGRGTTLFAARLLGHSAVGIDVNPVASAVSAAKLARADVGEVVALARDLLSGAPSELPSGDFWRLAYHPATLRDICSLREGLIATVQSDEVAMLRALMLGLLHGPLRKGLPTYLSNQLPRTYATKPHSAVRYWDSRGLEPPRVDVLDALQRRAHFTLVDVPPRTAGTVYLGDAREVLPTDFAPFDAVVTSPPYLGMRTYLPDQWLRAWFLGGPADVTYTQPGAILSADPTVFASALIEVFRGCATACRPGAELHVRFGALPSLPLDATDVITSVLVQAGWAVEDVRPAGVPRRGARQAEQMRAVGNYAPEVDCRATRPARKRG